MGEGMEVVVVVVVVMAVGVAGGGDRDGGRDSDGADGHDVAGLGWGGGSPGNARGEQYLMRRRYRNIRKTPPA